ncbi:MAG: hypothetical protein QW495_06600 [Candidatus Hadarchaeum sp.]|uniref:hypothetical protein n=1 Tax=Candidatus Hadarchaeum sp. TaxID=2883567 RepID=UPI00317BFC1A
MKRELMVLFDLARGQSVQVTCFENTFGWKMNGMFLPLIFVDVIRALWSNLSRARWYLNHRRGSSGTWQARQCYFIFWD